LTKILFSVYEYSVNIFSEKELNSPDSEYDFQIEIINTGQIKNHEMNNPNIFVLSTVFGVKIFHFENKNISEPLITLKKYSLSRINIAIRDVFIPNGLYSINSISKDVNSIGKENKNLKNFNPLLAIGTKNLIEIYEISKSREKYSIEEYNGIITFDENVEIQKLFWASHFVIIAIDQYNMIYIIDVFSGKIIEYIQPKWSNRNILTLSLLRNNGIYSSGNNLSVSHSSNKLFIITKLKNKDLQDQEGLKFPGFELHEISAKNWEDRLVYFHNKNEFKNGLYLSNNFYNGLEYCLIGLYEQEDKRRKIISSWIMINLEKYLKISLKLHSKDLDEFKSIATECLRFAIKIKNDYPKSFTDIHDVFSKEWGKNDHTFFEISTSLIKDGELSSLSSNKILREFFLYHKNKKTREDEFETLFSKLDLKDIDDDLFNLFRYHCQDKQPYLIKTHFNLYNSRGEYIKPIQEYTQKHYMKKGEFIIEYMKDLFTKPNKLSKESFQNIKKLILTELFQKSILREKTNFNFECLMDYLPKLFFEFLDIVYFDESKTSPFGEIGDQTRIISKSKEVLDVVPTRKDIEVILLKKFKLNNIDTVDWETPLFLQKSENLEKEKISNVQFFLFLLKGMAKGFIPLYIKNLRIEEKTNEMQKYLNIIYKSIIYISYNHNDKFLLTSYERKKAEEYYETLLKVYSYIGYDYELLRFQFYNRKLYF
jgi:hypothetical protein